jgi:hypothetical protein
MSDREKLRQVLLQARAVLEYMERNTPDEDCSERDARFSKLMQETIADIDKVLKP